MIGKDLIHAWLGNTINSTLNTLRGMGHEFGFKRDKTKTYAPVSTPRSPMTHVAFFYLSYSKVRVSLC